MSSRFWRAGGNAIRPNSNFLADVVSSATTFDAATTGSDIVLSGGALIATKSTSVNFWNRTNSTTAKVSGSVDILINAPFGNATIGFSTTATANTAAALGTDASGNDIAYRLDNGDLYFQNDNTNAVGTTFADGDVIRITKSATQASFYKQTGGAGAFNLLKTVTITGSPVAGAAFVTIAVGSSGAGQVFTANFTSW